MAPTQTGCLYVQSGCNNPIEFDFRGYHFDCLCQSHVIPGPASGLALARHPQLSHLGLLKRKIKSICNIIIVIVQSISKFWAAFVAGSLMWGVLLFGVWTCSTGEICKPCNTGNSQEAVGISDVCSPTTADCKECCKFKAVDEVTHSSKSEKKLNIQVFDACVESGVFLCSIAPKLPQKALVSKSVPPSSVAVYNVVPRAPPFQS